MTKKAVENQMYKQKVINESIHSNHASTVSFDGEKPYPTERVVSFTQFLVESQENDFYPGKVLKTIIGNEHVFYMYWAKDEHGYFNLLWSQTDSLFDNDVDWLPVEIDSVMLTTQVEIA